MSGTTGGERIASPSKVSAWLDCKHYLNLRHRVDGGTMEPPDNEFSAFAHLAANRRTRGVRVGTVDRFQGQEAPVVLFSMATSDASLVSRGSDFLFSRNRLNVALSRARCLAFLICTNDLLASRARNVEDMKLISTLCAFVEEAEKQQRTYQQP